MTTDKQSQSASKNAVAVQAGRDVVVHAGMSYEDVKAVALEVYRANFYQLVGIARDEASARAEQITGAFLDKLYAEYPEGIQQANDPGFQHALFTVQKEHAKAGDEDLGALLVDLLVDRSKQKRRDVLQLVLDESISTAPKLTDGQLANISLVFILKMTRNQAINGYSDLGEYLDKHVEPFINKVVVKHTAFMHLEFTGCGSRSLMDAALESIFIEGYPGLFQNGLTLAEIRARGIPGAVISNLFTPCLSDLDKWQVSALNTTVLEQRLEALVLEEDDRGTIRSLFESSKMSAVEVKAKVLEVRSYMGALFDIWSSSGLSNFNLTSVGIAIGHANVKKTTGEFTELSAWISE
jgi:hypothetical protein